jgi:hypothetical protein
VIEVTVGSFPSARHPSAKFLPLDEVFGVVTRYGGICCWVQLGLLIKFDRWVCDKSADILLPVFIQFSG